MKQSAPIAGPARPVRTESAGTRILQRQCKACGSHAPRASGVCEGCKDEQKRGRLQTKLRISKPGDAFEREADRIAAEVTRMSPDAAHSPTTHGGPLRLQRLGSNVPNEDSEVPSVVGEVLRSPGQPLDRTTKAFFETRFGHDFSHVRIHTDGLAAESANAVSAKAYTVGAHLVFDRGEYAPSAQVGRELLAHELSHVIQQGAAATAAPSGDAVLARRPALRPMPRPPMTRRPPPPPEIRKMMEPRPPRTERTGPLTQSEVESAVPEAPPRYVPEPGSLDWMLDQNAMGQKKYGAEMRITVTIIRGGKAPEFITEGKEMVVATDKGNFTYKPRYFHLLDALEHDAKSAKSNEDQFNIFVDYMPDLLRSMPEFADQAPVPSQTGKPTSFGTFRTMNSIVMDPWNPETADPKGKERLKVYFDAINSKKAPPAPNDNTKPKPDTKTKPKDESDPPPQPGTDNKSIPKHVPRGGRCPTGTKDDPIGMVWCKPLKFYKKSLKLYGGDYSRDAQKKLLYGDKEQVGVLDWPTPGSLLKRQLVPRGNVADKFKKAIEEEGFEQWNLYSPDHVVDLFFKGRDHFDNLWPLERAVNMRAGKWHPGQPVCFSDPPKYEPKWLTIGSSSLVGRWFVVKEVREPPP